MYISFLYQIKYFKYLIISYMMSKFNLFQPQFHIIKRSAPDKEPKLCCKRYRLYWSLKKEIKYFIYFLSPPSSPSPPLKKISRMNSMRVQPYLHTLSWKELVCVESSDHNFHIWMYWHCPLAHQWSKLEYWNSDV